MGVGGVSAWDGPDRRLLMLLVPPVTSHTQTVNNAFSTKKTLKELDPELIGFQKIHYISHMTINADVLIVYCTRSCTSNLEYFRPVYFFQ